jgi:hypothetical protein
MLTITRLLELTILIFLILDNILIKTASNHLTSSVLVLLTQPARGELSVDDNRVV